MTSESGKIYWRKNEQTYLPEIDPVVVGGIIDAELQRHAEGVDEGFIVSFEVLYNDHVPDTQSRRITGGCLRSWSVESRKIHSDDESNELCSFRSL